MVNRVRSAVLAGLVFSASLTLYILIWKRRKTKQKLPSTAQWKRVGNLKDILIFPLKSAGEIHLNEADCTELGLVQIPIPGLYTLKDRNFMVYRASSEEITLNMTYPNMVSIKTQPLNETCILFRYREKPDLKVTVPTVNISANGKASMNTKKQLNYLDCGDEASDWITEVIKGDKNAEGKLRLGFWTDPDRWRDGADENYNELGSYHFYTSYMLMTSSSVQDVIDRIPEHKVDYRQFRPNFYIETTGKPFAEDNWKWIKIGDDAVFLKIKDCPRCAQINVDPDSCKLNKKNEPLSTLNKYRRLKEGAGPMMGICLGLYKTGKVKIDDPVFITT